ncbi:MAG TPA: Ni/Fe hydrogenase subunit alpha [Anaeromyxobacteraceae bacterium]|jgi:NAD-reducing hydrogenase large subunit
MGRRLDVAVGRVEGHASVAIDLDAAGRVAGARVQVAELRGFERIAAGRPIREMPALTARICGICPASHAIAAARAGDLLLGAPPPRAAVVLRELLEMAQVVSSHALSFFHVSAPDLVAARGEEAPRDPLALARAEPELFGDGLVLRRTAQEATEAIAGRRIHAPFAVPGGVAAPLDRAARDRIAASLPAAVAAAERTLAWWLGELPRHADEAAAASFESLFLALAGPGGEPGWTGGRLRIVSAHGEVVADGIDPQEYASAIAESPAPWSYARLAHYAPAGPEAGLLRVGPLARLGAATRLGTPRAERGRRAFRALGRGAVLSAFHAHLARLVEILHALERMEALLADPAVLGREVLAPPGEPRREAVGDCEAPRGTLLHHYRVDGNGLVTSATLVTPTGINVRAMGEAVRGIAERYLEAPRVTERLRAKVEAGVRAFDPCFSCASHAAGGGWLRVELRGPGGELLDEG